MADEPMSESLQVVPGVDFPLPPEHLREALDNSSSAAPAKADAGPREASELDYIDGPPVVTVELRYRFRLEGAEVTAIMVRPLTVVEVGEVVRRVGADRVDVYDFYAVMTGLPAGVVRALVGDDGEEVTRAAWDFLPRFVKTSLGG